MSWRRTTPSGRKSPKCPQHCPDRDEWCHSTCEKYKQQVAEHEAEKALIRQDKMNRSGWTAGKRAAAIRKSKARLKRFKS